VQCAQLHADEDRGACALTTVVDAHTHFVPLEFLDFLRSSGAGTGMEVIDRDGRDPLISHDNGLQYPVFALFHDPAAKLAQMDRDGIDMSLCSIVPSLFLYELEPEQTLRAHRVINDAGAEYANRSGARIAVLATVPLNDPARAEGELRRACGELGLVGVEIGPSVGDMMLDDRRLDGFYAAAAELDVPVMLHPYLNMVSKPGPDLQGFHLGNVVGNPVETFVAASRLIVGGVFDRHPDLRVQLVHAGGAFTYQLGRLGHAYAAREDTRSVAEREPEAYLDRFLFDSIVFDERALRFLLERVGPDAVLFGTDLPFDMADLSALEALPRIAPPDVAEKALGANALRAYGLSAPGT
jgi:aminocarboxymuconate-semialdehyde decarboxylase